MRIPSTRTSPDTILCWPIFQGNYPQDCLVNTIFGAEDAPDQDHPSHGQVPTRNIGRCASSLLYREDNIPLLVERFIALVHIKNPLLDIAALRRNAKMVAENGPSWDGVSCLVLLACALGSLAQPLKVEWPQQHDLSIDEPSLQSTSHSRDDLETAGSYYILARKRIGLLSNGIVRSQCYFWSGVYLMYTINPVEAWQNFLQSSTTQHAYLKGRQSHSKDGAQRSQDRQLEQRLYWSCFKSECELRVELQLPESSIASIRYPDMFPSPPDPASPVTAEVNFSEQDFNIDSPMSQVSSVSNSQMQQQSWYYYLTEIALRRIANRVLNAFYKNELSLNMPLASMINHANNFEAESLQWHAGLPDVLQFDPDHLENPPTEELPYYIWARFLEMRHWIYLPFIFYAVHHGPEDPYLDEIQPMVNKGFKHVFACIEGLALRHRHHGIWFGLRGSTAAAFILVATVKCGHINVPSNWRDAIRSHIAELRYWENESPDIKEAKRILEEMLEELPSELIC
ncbi:vegetative cell wall protein gp1 [Phlyctema vagabunda]|uniref:Vegetative cell wall protein gp1 n=1 Tax=Phlyctema vagabunda TaxID=108571 RepID=A0ABR4P6A7_9HELO